MNTKILDRLAALRSAMEKRGIAAFIIPGTDPHLSEYCAEHWKAREWISGFNGSAGTAVVTTQKAVIATDSRYFLQAEIQLCDTTFDLLKQGLPDTPSIQEWIAASIPSGSTVAIDGAMFSTAEALSIKTYFEKSGFSFISDFDPFSSIWTDRPSLPSDPVFIHDEKYSGASARSKIETLNKRLSENGANATLLTALDEIAWVFNLRGADVECNPVAICYAFISNNKNILFVDEKKVTAEVRDYLSSQGISITGYDTIYDFLASLPSESIILTDIHKINFSLYNSLPTSVKTVSAVSPVALLKSIKNETQINGVRNAMIKDGIALVRFFMWLEKHISSGEIKETTIGEKLIEFRSQQPLFVGESFSTIAGFNAHGAIVHYHATPEQEFTITPNGFLLIDSGAQYLDGTTDITRTVALGPLTDRQKRDFTLVLKGHIGIATCRFPQGTRGAQIDVLARMHLWNHGLNYLHGTGHGIGHFLNVHEGPQNIRLEENPTPLMPGMITSNEPGVYLTGQYGIRTENLILTEQDQTNEFGNFYKFETLTLFPIDKKAIDKSLLSENERMWLNQYHQTVFEKLSPHLTSTERDWLETATAPIE